MYSCSFPGIRAGLLHNDEAKSQRALQTFAGHVRAFEAAQRCSTEGMKQLLARHPLSSLPMRFAAKMLAAEDYRSANCQLLGLVRGIFEGVGNTKLIEDGFQKLRDHETRDSTNKVQRRMASWENLVAYRLWNVHDRQELAPTTTGQPPTSFGPSLFVPVAGTKGDEYSAGLSPQLDLNRVMGSVDWATFDAQTQMERLGEPQQLLAMHRRGNAWDMCGVAWKSALLPEGQLVSYTGGDGGATAWLVIRGLPGAAMVWPCVRLAGSTFGVDVQVSELSLHIVLDWDQYLVHDTIALSPLALQVSGWAGKSVGPVLEVAETMPLLTWLALKGFPHIAEHVLVALCKDLDLVVLP